MFCSLLCVLYMVVPCPNCCYEWIDFHFISNLLDREIKTTSLVKNALLCSICRPGQTYFFNFFIFGFILAIVSNKISGPNCFHSFIVVEPKWTMNTWISVLYCVIVCYPLIFLYSNLKLGDKDKMSVALDNTKTPTTNLLSNQPKWETRYM